LRTNTKHALIRSSTASLATFFFFFFFFFLNQELSQSVQYIDRLSPARDFRIITLFRLACFSGFRDTRLTLEKHKRSPLH
jgi:hypothetical protein